MIRRAMTYAFCLALVLASAQGVNAACLNRFLSRSEGSKRVVTLLTGKLTFQEAQALTQAITEKKAPGIVWVDNKGKTIASQFGNASVVRPMPVGCDGRSSGVVMIVTFISAFEPTRTMSIKLDAINATTFEEQKQ